MPWQRLVADTALELNADQTGFRYGSVLVSVPRQSGKTTLLRPVMAHRCLTIPDGATYLTAQHRGDARDTWLNTVRSVERSPLARLAKVRRTNGSEGITWANGSELRVFAPAEDALHGKTADLVFVDEIWAFSAEQGRALLQAIVPTQATRPMSQVWMVSTAGTARSTWMRPMVDQAREELRLGQEPSGTAYFEWSIPPDMEDLTDSQVYAGHHPALGHTISQRALTAAQAVLEPGEFARAFGNFWVSSDSFYLAPAVWDAARTAEAFEAGQPVAFGAEVSPDRSGAVICAAGTLPGGAGAVEVVEYRGGVGWVAPRLMELVRRHRPCAVVVDPYGPARQVHAALAENRHVRVPLSEPFGAADFIQADHEFTNGVVEGTMRHRAHERLDAALSAAGSRTVREQTVIARTGAGGEHPTALIAAMLAAYGRAHPVADAPPPRLRVAQ